LGDEVEDVVVFKGTCFLCVYFSFEKFAMDFDENVDSNDITNDDYE